MQTNKSINITLPLEFKEEIEGREERKTTHPYNNLISHYVDK